MTTSRVASPPDHGTFGAYAPPPGAFVTEGGATRIVYPLDDRVRDDGAGGFRAEPGRYHLYVSLTCPWAQRPLIALKLRGLDSIVTWSAVDPVRDGRGWAFREGPGYGPDPVNGFELLSEAYLATDPHFDGHISVPALWDRSKGRLVSNHYPTLTADTETEFVAWADPDVELYPQTLRPEIDALDTEITEQFFHSGGAARAQSPSDASALAERTFAALAGIDERLRTQRYLLGDRLTDSDILLFVALVRFDVLFAAIPVTVRPQLLDHHHLWNYARDLYQQPAFASTTNFDQIQAASRPSTSVSSDQAKTTTQLAARYAAWDAPHDRHKRLAAASKQ